MANITIPRRDTIEPDPKAYNLALPGDVYRLLRECEGYLHTCIRAHHGTDVIGRQFALDALKAINSGAYDVAVYVRRDDGKCPCCHLEFKDGDTCVMGGCPMGGDF